MNQNYTCSIENHNNNDILGFCLNNNCIKPAQFCFQCFQEIHNSHQDDCVEFDSMEIQFLKQEEKILKFKGQIMKTIDKSLSNTRNLEKEFQKQMETIQRWSTQIKEKQFNQLSTEIKEIKVILKNDTDKDLTEILELYEVLNGKFQQYKNKINFNDNRKKAEALLNQEKWSEAISVINQLLSVDPKNDEILFQKFTTLLNLEDIEQAFKCFQVRVSINYDCPQFFHYFGQLLDYQENCQQALEILDKMELTLSNNLVFMNKGRALLALKQYEKAVEYFDKSLSLNPKAVKTIALKAKALLELDKPNEAIASCSEALQIDWKVANAHNVMGNALLRLGNFQESINCFRQAISIDPSLISSYQNIAMALCTQNKQMEAQEWFDKALVIDPKSAITLNNKGHSLMDLEKFDEAISCFDQILQINPKCGQNYQSKGEALIYIGKLQQAIDCFETGIQEDPQFAENYNSKGLVLLQLQRFEAALECFEQAISLGNIQINFLSNKAMALFYLKQFDKALDCYDFAISIHPTSEVVYFYKSKLLYDLKEYNQALICIDQSIKLNPKFELSNYQKCKILLDQHQFEESLFYCKEARKLIPSSRLLINIESEILIEMKEFDKAPQAFKVQPQQGPRNPDLTANNRPIQFVSDIK